MPNFLEAQTRSKVSSVHANMRTLATGLEAYAVDQNAYPFAINLNTSTWVHPGQRLAMLTTPTSYLTSFPKDIFESRVGNWDYWSGMYWYEDRKTTLEHWHTFCRPLYENDEIAWLIISKGPSLQSSFWTPPPQVRPYDSTNGTISAGEIRRYGPGQIDEAILMRP